jgi:hypothetical protein
MEKNVQICISKKDDILGGKEGKGKLWRGEFNYDTL